MKFVRVVWLLVLSVLNFDSSSYYTTKYFPIICWFQVVSPTSADKVYDHVHLFVKIIDFPHDSPLSYYSLVGRKKLLW